jgi:hypothetical protein
MDKEYAQHKCPICFKCWSEENYLFNLQFSDNTAKEKQCDFCEKNYLEMSSLELLQRRLDVLPYCYASDFPKVIAHLVEHIDLREEPK